MKSFKSILLLALVFLAGMVAGVAGARAIARHAEQVAINNPERAQQIIERNLSRRLRLNADQQAQLHVIMTGARGQMVALRQEYRPQIETIYQQTDAKITGLLTPAQQARYEKIRQEEHVLFRPLRQGSH